MPDLYTAPFLADLRDFSPALRAEARETLQWLRRNPEPDGVTRRAAPPPFKPDTLIAIRGRLAIRYKRDALGLVFIRIQVRPNWADTDDGR